MIPILYPASEISFTTNGLGRLTDALTCTVVEEVNGVFELNMTYPLDGIHLDDMDVNMIIYAKPSFGRKPQPFRIREIVKSWGNKVSITARHFKYELDAYVVAEFGQHSVTGYASDPILYDQNHLVIGVLTETLSKSIVKNGNVYTLKMNYPSNGRYASSINTNCYLYAQPEIGKNLSEFDITSVSNSGSVISVTASRTGSSDQQTELNQMTVAQALHVIYGYTIANDETEILKYPFTYDTVPDSPTDTWATQLKTFWNKYPVKVSEILSSEQDRVIDLYGGEWEWDHYRCILHEHRGKDSGVIYKYGKNITDINATTNIDEFYTHAVSYWKGTMSSSTDVNYVDNNYTDCYVSRGHSIKILPSEYESMFPNPRALIIDASSEFDEKPTIAQLDDYTRWYVKAEGIDVPRVSIKVDVVDLASTEEYKDYAPLETVQLCDYVTVIFPQFGVDLKEQISRIEYNVLTDKNTSVTIGETKLTLADHLASTKKNLRRNKYSNQQWADQCAERAIRASSGWYGGNIKKVYNESDHKQQAAYVMDSDNEDTASHVLKADKNGISGGTNGTRGEMDSIISLNNPNGEVGVNGSKVNYGRLAAQGQSTRYFDLDSGKSEMVFGENRVFANDNGLKAISYGTDGLNVDNQAVTITGNVVLGRPGDNTKVSFQDISDLKEFLTGVSEAAGAAGQSQAWVQEQISLLWDAIHALGG